MTQLLIALNYFYYKYFANNYEYGICKDMFARRHKRKRNVQYIFKKIKGIHNKKRIWKDFDSIWWSDFTKIK